MAASVQLASLHLVQVGGYFLQARSWRHFVIVLLAQGSCLM